uniref:Replication-associated protein n=1 Tax=Cressdnaviricota sp. TaxID=2748378 RepID=A0A6M3YP62_9VIRU|nr:MAG: replication-associated protein [Cressdnaviricota sp.]
MYADRAYKKAQLDTQVNTISNDYLVEGTILSTTLETLRMPEDMTSLWIKGPSGIGKTTWALTYCEKPLLFVRHLDTLRQFRPGFHKTIVFDDMNFSHLPRPAQIELVDRYHPQQVHVRYAVVDIPAKTPKVFLSNDIIFIYDEAINRRLTALSIAIA